MSPTRKKTLYVGLGLIVVGIVGNLTLYILHTLTPEPVVVTIAHEPEHPLPTYINASTSDILLKLPFPDAVVGKTFSLVGRARGPWYFEASFPAVLLDKDGNVLWQGPVHANGNWMTTEFVPFRGNVVISNQSYIGKGTLILKKDNPSGEPARDASLTLPINIEY